MNLSFFKSIFARLWLTLMCGCLPVLAGSVQLVSVRDLSEVAPAGGDSDSGAPMVSPDGRYVVFASGANNLTPPGKIGFVPAQTLERLNVFLRDRTNGTTTLVSVNSAGTAGGNGDSLPDGMSSNGRYIVFESSASDLVAGDSNNVADVFVRDTVAGTTTMVSVSTTGAIGNGASGSAAMTPDGRYVAFVSAATNLVANDTNGIPDVFVRDLNTGQTRLVSVGAQNLNTPFPSIGSANPEITPDGNYVAFYSTATNLVAGVTNSGDIYVRALNTGTTYWISTNARPLVLSILGNTSAVAYNQQISTNGNYVAFEANSSGAKSGLILRYNLQTGLTDVADTNATTAISGLESAAHDLDMTPDGRFISFVANTNTSGTCIAEWDGQTGMVSLVSSNLNGGVTAGTFADWPVMDASGQFVAFVSNDPDLTTNSASGGFDLYARDMSAGTMFEVDVAPGEPPAGVGADTIPAVSADGQLIVFDEPLDGKSMPNDRNHAGDLLARVLGAPTNELISAHDSGSFSATPNGPSFISGTSVSSNGLFVAFASDADNVATNDTNGWRDIFVRDFAHGTTILASVGADGVSSGNGLSTDPTISSDGRYVAFTSAATNLVRGDTNSAQDVFVRDLQAQTNELVSAGTGAGSFGNGASYSPTISANGRLVLFHSKANNLAAGSFTSFAENLFLRDRTLRTNYALTFAGVSAAAMTPDGRYTAFNGALSGVTYHVYVWDSLAARMTFTNAVDSTSAISAISVSSNGQWLAYLTGSGTVSLRLVNVASNSAQTVATGSFPSHPGLSFSADGRFLAFATTASIATLDMNGLSDIYVFDTLSGTNLLVTESYNASTTPNGAADAPLISPDGRFVAYRSFASNNIPGDTNGVADLFVYDRSTGTTTLLTQGQTGGLMADDRSLTANFASDSQTLFFTSWASDLVGQDYNRFEDVFAVSPYTAMNGGFSNLPPSFAGQLSSLAGSGSSAQNPVVSWPVIPGRGYAVQFKNDLSDPDWQTLSGGVTLIGTNGYAYDLAPAGGRRFYRVVLSN